MSFPRVLISFQYDSKQPNRIAKCFINLAGKSPGTVALLVSSLDKASHTLDAWNLGTALRSKRGALMSLVFNIYI